METQKTYIEKIAAMTAELRKKVQEIPTSGVSDDQLVKIRVVENGILMFQRDLCELAQTYGIGIGKDFWWPE